MSIYPSDLFFSAASCFISLLISLRRFLAARVSWGPSPRFRAANSCRRTIMRSDSSLMRLPMDPTLHPNWCISDAANDAGVGPVCDKDGSDRVEHTRNRGSANQWRRMDETRCGGGHCGDFPLQVNY